MKKNLLNNLLHASFALLVLFRHSAKSEVVIDPPVTAEIGAHTDISVVAPANTVYGTRGLSQTNSAESLGEGRLIFGFNGSWYQQMRAFPGVPNQNANIFTGIGAVALGVNRQIDVFASLMGYGSTDYDNNSASGLGSLGGGIQGTLPFESSTPVRLAAQVGIFQGLSKNPINSNGAEGYNYFQTRTGLDFMAKLIQTFVIGGEGTGIKFHANEGLVTSAENGTDPLLLLGAGGEMNMRTLVAGLEIHSRTPMKAIDVGNDPLWITPSLQFRTPYSMNILLGGDISLSPDRGGAINSRPLEPYRLLAGLNFTLDTEAGKRLAAKDKAMQEALQKRQLMNDNQSLANRNRNLSNTLVKETRDDSLARARQKGTSDSLAAKAHQDSLAMAAKARQDSLYLAEARKNLDEEKSKRSDAEKQLLSTGLLLLDAVYFETGKTDISINSRPYLNIIAKMLTKYPKLQIEVAGHTDDVGNDANNQILSQGRAQSVEYYTIQMAPELKSVLTAKGYGESKPKADNKTAEGRKLNRRTELEVTNKEVLAEYNP